MNRAIRSLGGLLGLLLIALLINVNVQQVFLAKTTMERPGNQRAVLQEYSRQRGPILVGSDDVARSIRNTGDSPFKFLRLYEPGARDVSATGFYSMVYGSTGIEKAENGVLSGTDDRFFIDRLGQLFSGKKPKGGAVQLTLNSAAQNAAWSGLQGKVGSVTAIEPETGKILAQVQSPSFDPNLLASTDTKSVSKYYEQLDSDPTKPMLNRPLVQTLPPGSTFKLVTAAAALESGRFEPDTEIPGPKSYPLPGTSRDLNNWSRSECGPNGKTTLSNALAVSCNSAFAWLGNELGAKALDSQSRKFGFETNFTTPLRAAASRFPKNPDDAQTAMSAIGQFDVTATSLQMAMVTAAIGNGGVTMNPYVVDQIRGPNLSVLSTTKPSDFDRAMSPENARKLVDMMVSVVESGTGSNARIPGITVGGKTGTAETAPDRPAIAWFVALAPAEAPKVAVAVAVENNRGATEVSGNQFAAPIARAVIEAVLRG